MHPGVHEAARVGITLALLAVLGTPGSLAQEREGPAPFEGRGDESSFRSVTLAGFVLAPDGSPAEGAVVVSSAGGKAVADAAGSYRLELALPRHLTSVQITALGSGGSGRLASTQALLSAAGTTRVDPLTLALGASCSPRWLPTFGDEPGTDRDVLAFAVFDDGGGPALHVGGEFLSAGGAVVNGVVKWDGSSWSPLGSGVTGQIFAGANRGVRALVVHDDGGGPALYAGGAFTAAGGVSANYVAKWNGSSWSNVGNGFNSFVNALAVYDDGSGPALFAAGHFSGGGGGNRIAKWNGVAWSQFTGRDGTVHALVVHDDGTGSALYAGGEFTDRIARWNGASWSQLGTGTNGVVRTLAVHDDGGGAALYAGGEFTTAGGVPASRIARWDGSVWSALGPGMTASSSASVWALSVHDDGGGPALYAGGRFTSAGGVDANSIARWDGSVWSALGSGAVDTNTDTIWAPVRALVVWDDGGGPALFAGGGLNVAGEVGVSHIARWRNSAWSALGGDGLNGGISALATYDDGNGVALYVSGSLTTAGGVAVRHIARWDGSNWSALGSGLSRPANDLVVHDDGGGPALYAGGSFSSAGGVSASRIAKWDGSSWSPLGSGISSGPNHTVQALASLNDGNGPALYAGGLFSMAGGVPALSIAKWDGTSWSALGSGITGGFAGVRSLCGYDDGSGPALYAAGQFTMAGGVPAGLIAKWDGTSWSALGSGLTGPSFPFVSALAVFDDGGGPALYAGGYFETAGGQMAVGIASWDGSAWSALHSLQSAQVSGLVVFDDGSGPALHASGSYGLPGGAEARGIGRWDGSGWTRLGNEISAGSMAVFDDGNGPALFAAGSATDSGDSYLSKWGYPEDLDPPTLACPESVLVVDGFGGPSGETVSFTVSASDCRDPAPSLVCVPPSGSFFPRGTTLVTCTSTDAAGNQATCEFPVTVALKARRR